MMEKNRGTILIVDDNPNNLKVVAGVLTGNGYDFRMAKSGQLALNILSALKIMNKAKPDLILLDIQMPEMDGYETCKKIKENDDLAGIPIIFLTANTDAESVKKAFQSGGVDFVTKPFNTDELLARINTHITLKSQAEELELQNATKDKFFSIISHDLKNPLSGVIGFSELLKEALKENRLDAINKYAEVIHKSAIYSLDLLQNLLEWSRVQVGSLVSSKSNFDLSELLKSNMDDLATQALAKNIQVKGEFHDKLFVHADDKMISTIVRNLLSNAIKFTPKGGAVTVLSKEKISNDKKVIETEIRDTGIGISKVNVDKLFKIEQNYKSIGTDNEKGTGLGLILCKEFMNQNNGTIRVESEPGVGSSFIFTLDCSN